jgi:DNA-binding PadR family transcriptional regulator
MIRVSKVRISITRGFSGCYVLELPRWNPVLTDKQITDKTIEDSEGLWRPSPRPVYCMLSKLLAEGLIKEMDNGRYSATKKGIDILADIESACNILQGQIDILPRICKVVKSATDRLFTRG